MDSEWQQVHTGLVYICFTHWVLYAIITNLYACFNLENFVFFRFSLWLQQCVPCVWLFWRQHRSNNSGSHQEPDEVYSNLSANWKRITSRTTALQLNQINKVLLQEGQGGKKSYVSNWSVFCWLATKLWTFFILIWCSSTVWCNFRRQVQTPQRPSRSLGSLPRVLRRGMSFSETLTAFVCKYKFS